ncbi:MAG: DUF262 domain-containing protein [Peptococcaceae bacterium]|nr:DUF262 domain-containing protein [Peptococcaceae bacterium]
MNLLQQIEEGRQEISTDNYSMSVGELLTMYRDRELELHPEFQRFFRWTPEQKSRLIESLLLGIPIPSIFVQQLKNGKWEVIDGLQRLSTIFEVAGELRDANGIKRSPFVLTKTKYLPDLENLQWDNDSGTNVLPNEARLIIKRSKVNVNIVLGRSDESAKYELFQRLNTGGAPATDQEVRNAILIMVNREFFAWISDLAKYDCFRECIPLTERALEEQFDLELVTRFLVLRALPESQFREFDELGSFLTDVIVQMAKNFESLKEEAGLAFRRTFETFARLLGENSFKKFDEVKQKATGAMLISLYEVLAIGLGAYTGDPAYNISDGLIDEWHRRLPGEMRFTTATGSGIRATTRIPNTVRLGREIFCNENS